MLIYTAPCFGGSKRNRHGGTPETGKHRARGVPRQRTEESREVLWRPVRMEIPRSPGPGLLTIPSGELAWGRHWRIATRKLAAEQHSLHQREVARRVPGAGPEGRWENHRSEE